MVSRWGSALTAACVALFALMQAPAMAQVEWVASLNPPLAPVALTQQTVASAGDGSIYTVSQAADGETTRVRLARISATGTTQWVRWVSGSYNTYASRLPLFVHQDNSASIVYQDNSSSTICIENFSVMGDSRSRDCSNNSSDFRATLAADGDLYVASYVQRIVKKVSPTGLLRWTRTDSSWLYGVLYSVGVDSAGNYFEIQDGRLRTWGSVDGNKLNDVPLTGFAWYGYTLTGKEVVPRAGREFAHLRSVSVTNNALVATIARYRADGTSAWTRDIVFPTYGSNDYVALMAADSDGIYVVRSSAGDGDSQIAKLSATGTILWQRHYARARRVIESANGLLALRADVSTTNGTSDSLVFPVAAADGALGSPTIYSRPDVFAPSDWFAVPGGVVATFQGNNPFAPYTGYPASLGASSIFIGSLAANRWLVTADIRPSASVSQSDCLMPRLGKSSPSSWWARTQPTPQNSNSDWSTVNSASGAREARTALSAPGCGAPLAADGGQIVVSSSSDRIKKVAVDGTSVWQTSSLNFAAQYGSQPLESIAASGDITYAAGSLLGRATAAGGIVFEAETNRANPRYLAVDSANNAWVVSSNGYADGYVTKVSPAGVLQWSIAIDSPACNDSVMAALLTTSDEMLVTTQSCGEGRAFKVNAAGQIAWQRIVSGTTLRPYVQLSALAVDSAGNIYAGGCASSGSPANTGVNAISILASWSGAGAERWSVQSDLIGGASECVTSIATDSSNNVYAASSSSVTTRAPVLWSFTSAGVERWRHSAVLSAPFAAATELTTDNADKLIALGEAPPSSTSSREATLRRINVASLGSPLRLKFLEVPATPVGYREQFTVRIGLRTAADVASNATSDTVVSIGLQTGTGTLDGSLTCIIATGASECTIADTRYDVVESGVTLTAGADGFATATSSPMGFRRADTTTVISALSTAPYNAFSVVRVRAGVQGPPPAANQGAGGSLNGPYSPANPGLYNCTYGSAPSALPTSDCDLLVYTASMPLSAQFSSYDNRYNGSTASGFSLPVTKVTPTLVVSNDPGNSYVSGDRVRFRVALMLPGGFNASQFISAITVSVTGGTCASWITAGSVSDQFAGSYRICEIAAAAVGPLNVTIGFIGNDDLLAATPVTHSVTINPGAIIRGYANLVTSVTVCSPTPGVTCSIDPSNSGFWQCVGPVGMSGQVFFVPTSPGGPYNFPGSPVNYSNVTGLVNSPANVTWAHQVYACKPDVDGDGAVLAMTDGMLVLRRMLGLSGAALIEDVSHACVPLSAAGIASAITLANYDLDGDGQVRAETDGLLLLRAMLGFRGTALVNGAIGAGAARQTGSQILGYLSNTCAFPLNP